MPFLPIDLPMNEKKQSPSVPSAEAVRNRPPKNDSNSLALD
jgi:hypothetical protein